MNILLRQGSSNQSHCVSPNFNKMQCYKTVPIWFGAALNISHKIESQLSTGFVGGFVGRGVKTQVAQIINSHTFLAQECV